MQTINIDKFVYEKCTGYEYAYVKNHPLGNKSGKVRLHRYVMSLHIGRWLSSFEHVHHIDENKSNNDIANLLVMCSSEHTRLHKTGCIKEKFYICKQCSKSTKNKIFCDRGCRGLFERKCEITKEELQALIWAIPYTKAGEKLGLSDTGIKKKAISLGCLVPPNRFHVRNKVEKDKIRRQCGM